MIGGNFEVIDFSGLQFPKSVILYAVFFYVRYAGSYRDLEEIMAERGVVVDHATLNRWVVKFSPLIAVQAQARKRPTASSWRMDETYIQVKGRWTYLYRAVDRNGETLDFMLSERRDLAAARRFFRRAMLLRLERSASPQPLSRLAVARSLFLTNADAQTLSRDDLLLTAMWGQDEPQTLRYAILQNCSMGADGGHRALTVTGRLLPQ